MDRNIAIVIPTYNEYQNILPLVTKIRILYPTISIYFVDGNSQDDTQKIIKTLAEKDRHVHLIAQDKKNGLGLAYIQAFEYILQKSNITHVLTMDGDLSHNPTEIPQFLDTSKTYDVVIGSRIIKYKSFQPENGIRNVMSKALNWYINIFLNVPVQDMSSGFAFFPLHYISPYMNHLKKTSGYIFQAHIKYILYKQTKKIKEVPIYFNKRIAGKSKLTLSIICEALYKTPLIKYYNRNISSRP